MLAKSSKIDELQIDEEEAEKLAKAALRVSELYEIPLPSEKVLAWIGLANAMGRVYGPRIAAYTIRQKMKPKVVEGKFKEAKPTAAPPQRMNGGPVPNSSIFEDA